jgi:hypothetical protein
MHRLAPVLLLSGVALLVSWVTAPAAPSPSPLAIHEEAPLDQAAPIVADITAQVDHLKNRLETIPEFPQPERDPFRFGTPPPPPVKETPPVVDAAPPAAPPGPVLPKLLAIVATDADGGVVLTAAFSIGDFVHVVKVGDTLGTFVVRSISAEVAELADSTTGTIYKILLH